MATYKLIQDIEAEDHILGPLSFRQFVFALIAVFLFYMCFLVVAKHVPFLLVIFAPPALFFGFFAMPFGRDQPTEIWALAKLRFLFKPRKRIWDQSGVKELVTITVPKKIEHVFTDGLSQNEVKSRLTALANTLDSRGWAVKNAVYGTSSVVVSSDRLVDIGSLPQEVPDTGILPADDILDEVSNPIAHQFDTMIDASAQARRKQLIDELNGIRAGQSPTNTTATQPTAPTAQSSNWFMSKASPQPTAVSRQPSGMANSQQPANGLAPAAAEPSGDEVALAARLRSQNQAQQASYSHLRTVQPVASQQPPADSAQLSANSQGPAAGGYSTPDPAILTLANNNDLNVSTLAREAKKAKGGDSDEVVISLH